MPAEYSKKSDFSKGEIIRNQVARCSENRSKEMKQGYYNYTSEGKKIYMPDTRKAWISSVKTLKRLLEPEIREDKDVKEKIDKFMKKAKKVFENYAYYPRKKVFKDAKPIWVKIEKAKAFIPEIDSALPTDDPDKPNSSRMKRIPGVWNDYVNMYWDEMVEIYDNIFAELNILIHKNNYFKQSTSYGFDLIDDEDEEDEED